MGNLARQLKAIGACEDAVLWAKDYKTLAAAWKACERGDWMLWLCGRMGGKKGWPARQQIVLVACDCAELVLPIYEKKYPDDKCVRDCIEVTRKWANGEATIEEVQKARSAAYAADYAYAASAYAAASAADYAYAAADYACAAASAYASAYAAADYAYAAYYAAADYAYAASAYAAADYAYAAADYAAADYAYAASSAYAAARLHAYKQCADFCRDRLKIPAILEAK